MYLCKIKNASMFQAISAHLGKTFGVNLKKQKNQDTQNINNVKNFSLKFDQLLLCLVQKFSSSSFIMSSKLTTFMKLPRKL